MYERVMVRKRPRDRCVYLCRYDRIKDSPGIILHCGACGRGIVLPKKGDRCRVCGARVISVLSRETPTARGRGNEWISFAG